jgi:hypothetical protein
MPIFIKGRSKPKSIIINQVQEVPIPTHTVLSPVELDNENKTAIDKSHEVMDGLNKDLSERFARINSLVDSLSIPVVTRTVVIQAPVIPTVVIPKPIVEPTPIVPKPAPTVQKKTFLRRKPNSSTLRPQNTHRPAS